MSQTAPDPLTSEQASDADMEDDHSEVEITPEEGFVIELTRLLRVFSMRQAEVLRISEYVDASAAEIDDVALRAQRQLEQQLGEADLEVLDSYIETLSDFLKSSDDTGEVNDEASDMEDAPESKLRDRLVSLRGRLPEGAETAYMNAVLTSLRPSVGVQFLNNSLLMTVVSELETFINQIARACFEHAPQHLNASGRTYSWKDVSQHSTLDDFRTYVIDNEIDELLRGSLEDWLGFFQNRFSIPPVEVASSYSAQETMQRRHCIVHNGALASQQYLDKLKQFKLSVQVGDELPVDSDYLRRAADALYLIVYSLTWSLGVKLITAQDARQSLLSELASRTMILVQEGRYELVKEIGSFVPYSTLKGEDLEYTSFVFRVNTWLAFKESGNFAEVRPEVEAFGVRNKSDWFKVAKAALLDDETEALAIARRLMEFDQLDSAHILTWPLFRKLRALVLEDQKE
jgi:hypothetical protein